MSKKNSMQIGKFVEDDATYIAAQFHTYNSFLWKLILSTKPAVVFRSISADIAS